MNALIPHIKNILARRIEVEQVSPSELELAFCLRSSAVTSFLKGQWLQGEASVLLTCYATGDYRLLRMASIEVLRARTNRVIKNGNIPITLLASRMNVASSNLYNFVRSQSSPAGKTTLNIFAYFFPQLRTHCFNQTMELLLESGVAGQQAVESLVRSYPRLARKFQPSTPETV